jgi:microcystin degradation protein MlrC
MRIFIAAIGTETNTFSPIPTGRASFEETLLRHGDGGTTSSAFAGPLAEWREMSSPDDTIVESIAAFAMPGGPTSQSVWQELRDTLLRDLEAHGPFDLVLLHLHGAMIATGCDDCEGELMEAVKRVTGPNAVVGVELDLHAHLTDRMVANADAIIMYKEYPHTDIRERARELYSISRHARETGQSLCMSMVDCRQLGVWRTSDPLVAELVKWMKDEERQRPNLLSLSFCHGFPWADVPEVGAKALAVAAGSERSVAENAAKDLADRILALRETYAPTFIAAKDALVATARTDNLTIVADVADNPGAGGPGDSTYLLADLLASDIADVVVGMIWDPVAVRLCVEAGEGERIALRIGGKLGPLSGTPLDIRGRIVRIVHDVKTSFGGGNWEAGTLVWLDLGRIQLVINSVRTQTLNPDVFEQVGMDLNAYRAFFIKSAQHFVGGFSRITDRFIYAVCPGVAAPAFESLSLPRAGRPLWPNSTDQ